MTPSPLLKAARGYIRHAPGSLGKAGLIRLLDPRLTRRAFAGTTVTRTGAAFAVTTSDVIQRYLYLFGVWEPHLTAFMSARLAPGDTVIDAGANIGYFTVLTSRLVGPAGRVIAIEPSPDFGRSLTANIRVNGCDNVRTVAAAVSGTDEELTFYLERSTNLGGTTAVRPRTVESSFRARAAPLPSLVTEAELADARLIKLDVEGGEAAAIRGLVPLLPRLRHDVELVIEVTPRHLAKQGLSVNDVVEPLLRHGFHAYRLTNDYDPATYPNAIRNPEPPRRWTAPITEMTDLVFSRVDASVLQ